MKDSVIGRQVHGSVIQVGRLSLAGVWRGKRTRRGTACGRRRTSHGARASWTSSTANHCRVRWCAVAWACTTVTNRGSAPLLCSEGYI